MQCSGCGHSNRPGQKFCGECGDRLDIDAGTTDPSARRVYTPAHLEDLLLAAPSSIEGERKPITVLFCDIAGSTAIAELLGAERMHAALNAFFEVALAEVHRYEGTVNQFLGDGFMALFGAPQSHEDHARRAVLAALAIRDAVGRSRVVERDVPLQLRMGLNSGAVVVGRIGDGLRMDYTAVGDTTNVAARIQQQAEPGSILVSDSVWRSTQAYARFRSLGALALKGKMSPVPIHELLAANAVQSAQRRDHMGEPPTLVGRDAEIGVVIAALEQLRAANRGGVIVLVGDAGLGKSRLLEEARRRSRENGLVWLQGDCLSFGRTMSYWSFRELIRCHFGVDEHDDEHAAWAKVHARMGELFGEDADELLPYIGTLLSIAMPAPLTQRVQALDSHAMGRQIFRATLLTFERSAQQQPLILAFEDWHWADASSAALLEHLLPLSDRAPILFVVTSRPPLQGPAERLLFAASGRADVRLRNARVIDLSPIPAADSVRLAERLLGSGTLSRPLQALLLKRAEGNPFYVGELVRTMLATGIIERGDSGEWHTTAQWVTVPLPDTIEGVILARIDQLGDESKQVLKAAAVIGRSFLHRVLRAVTPPGGALDRQIARLLAASLIDERPDAPEREYVFRHPLIQQVAYDSLLQDRRRQMHRLVGQTIETLFVDRLEPFHAMLAYHFTKAEDPDKAREYLFKAADHADRLAADEEALELYGAVIADAERSPLRGLSALHRAQLDIKIGDAHFRAGRHHLALEALESAARRLRRPPPRTRAAVGSAVALGLLGQWARPVLSRWWSQQARPISEIDATACRVWETMAWIHFFTDQLHQLYDTLRIVQISKRDPTVRAHTIGLGVMGVVFSSIGAYRTAQWFHERARDAAERYGDPATKAHTIFFEGMHCQAVGQWRRAIALHEEAAELSWAAGDIRLWASTTSNLFLSLHRAGKRRMFEVAERFERVVDEAADRHAQAWSLTASAMVLSQRGRHREALDVLDRAVTVCRDIPEHRALAYALGLRCNGLRTLGHLVDAERCGAEAVELLRTHRLTGIFNTVPLMAYADATLALLRQSHTNDRGAIRRAARAVRQAVRQGHRVHDDGAVDSQRIAGELKLVRGDVNGAHDCWALGLQRSDALGTVPARARLLEARGRMCGVAADCEAARKLYEQCSVTQGE